MLWRVLISRQRENKKMIDYKKIIKIDGREMSRNFIAKLNLEERLGLVEPIFKYFRELGWMLPEMDERKFLNSYDKLKYKHVDVEWEDYYNNSSLATDICQYFCRESYFSTKERGGLSLKEVFMSDELLVKVIKNRLGLSWYDSEPKSTFNLTPKMVMYQGPRSMRLVSQITMFKPFIAKIIFSKFSNKNDVVYDFSAGFGGRFLGAVSCGRKYIGVDPLTCDEVNAMGDFLGVSPVSSDGIVYNDCSENFNYGENTIDMAFSSPPYYDQEYYSDSIRQAYNSGEDYFYNVYWLNTVDNVYKMLKKDKVMAVNLRKGDQRMLDVVTDKFGKCVDIFRLRTVRSHLNKTGKDNAQKYEPVFIFKK